jgi:nicotinate-nucleotide pyrophosphorylase (carboxylating)
MRHPALEQGLFEPLTPKQASQFSALVSSALSEDGAARDITSAAIVSADARAVANLVLRSRAVVAGLEIAALAFHLIDRDTRFSHSVQDGELFDPKVLARIDGSAPSLLAAERVALNFLGHLSGIATLTRTFVDRVRDLQVRICDTRKTTPGLRALERYAVRAGGGYNHRFNLSDALLIKDNHLAAAGSLARAVELARATAPEGAVVEVECESVEQVEEALRSRADAILLDNMSLEQLRRAVTVAHGKAILEASGGVTLANVRDVALSGVDVISVGALTHSAPSADVALDFVSTDRRHLETSL